MPGDLATGGSSGQPPNLSMGVSTPSVNVRLKIGAPPPLAVVPGLPVSSGRSLPGSHGEPPAHWKRDDPPPRAERVRHGGGREKHEES
jgi:hypothetical protein